MCETIANIKYKKNFLKNVIFRIDFSPILIIKKEISSEFQEKIRADLPELEENKSIILTTNVVKNKDTGQVQRFEENEISKTWNFLSKDRNRKVICNHEYLAIEFYEYLHFEDYIQFVEKVYTSFLNIYKPLEIKRLGLRYINNILIKEGNPFDFRELISPILTSFVDNFFDNKDDFSRVLSRVNLNKDDFKIIFTFGWYNTDFPEKISRKEFLLDYDCFTENIEEKEVVDLVKKFRQQIKLYFEKSIDDGLRKLMEVSYE
ncbi:MAG: TIGR04255 family protein [Candidatus Thorarchaeota archaeon]